MLGVSGKVAVVFACALVCSSALAEGEYSDPSGFSFACPAGWTIVAKGLDRDKLNQIPSGIQNWLKQNRFDLNLVSAVIIRNGNRNEGFLENVNVVVERQQLPMDEESAKKMSKLVVAKFRSAGATVDKVESRVRRLGNHDVIVLEFESKYPFSPLALKQKQVAFPGGGSTYFVTCTARVDTFARYSQVFDSILSSFKMPPAAAQGLFAPGFDWMPAVLGAVVGGVVGGLVVLFRAARKL